MSFTLPRANMETAMMVTRKKWIYLCGFVLMGLFVLYCAELFSTPSNGAKPDIRTLDEIQELHIDVSGTKVAYFDTRTGKRSVILLHGAVFSKATWLELGTLTELNNQGYRAIALDLPHNLPSARKADFLREFLADIDVGAAPVIISPSMSGSFAVPLVFSSPSSLGGWVAIAPVSLNSHQKSEYQNLHLPTLAVYGEKDSSFRADVESLLGSIPGVTMTMVPNGSHPCYKDNPTLWHLSLLSFLNSLPE